MNTARRILVASALATMAAGLASANSINGTCTTLGPNPTELNGSVSCTGFTLSGATLESISLTLTGLVTDQATPPGSTLTITNHDTSSHTGSATTISKFFLTSTLSGFSFPLAAGNTWVVDATTGVVTVGAGATTPFSVSGSDSDSGTDNNSATFGGYEAASFTIPVATKTGFSSNFSGGNVTVAQQTTDEVEATVTYTYTTSSGTPEPGTFGLLGAALVGLGFLGKRRKRSQS